MALKGRKWLHLCGSWTPQLDSTHSCILYYDKYEYDAIKSIYLARAAHEQAGHGLLDVITTEDVWRNATEEHVMHLVLLGKPLKLRDLSLPVCAERPVYKLCLATHQMGK